MSFFSFIKWRIKDKIREKTWRQLNQNNQTTLGSIFPLETVEVGKGTYGALNVMHLSESGNVKIGCYCSIAPAVTFLVGADHNLKTISTYPFRVKCLHTAEYEAISKGNIIVQDDVWIGYGATILSGVTVHQGAVIAAGAVVCEDVPAYSIVGGVPAKVIKYRFNEEVRKKLEVIDFSKLTEDMVREHIEELYETVTEESDLSWLPMRDEETEKEDTTQQGTEKE